MRAGRPSANLAEGNDSRDKEATFGRTTLDKAEDVVAAAEAEPEKYARLVEDMDRTGRANGVWRRLTNMQQAERIRAVAAAAAMHGPYSYEIRREDPSHRATTPYPQMSIADICALPARVSTSMRCCGFGPRTTTCWPARLARC